MTMAAGVSSRPSSSPADEAAGGSERGATAVEYGLLISGIAALIAVAVYMFGSGVLTLFTGTCDVVMSVVGGAC